MCTPEMTTAHLQTAALLLAALYAVQTVLSENYQQLLTRARAACDCLCPSALTA
jgi:hypothetical protein